MLAIFGYKINCKTWNIVFLVVLSISHHLFKGNCIEWILLFMKSILFIHYTFLNDTYTFTYEGSH